MTPSQEIASLKHCYALLEAERERLQADNDRLRALNYQLFSELYVKPVVREICTSSLWCAT